MKAGRPHPEVREDVKRELNRRGRRMTPQRAAILEVLRATKRHPTAEVLHAEVQKIVPRISLGTVYRNLQVLVDEGYAVRLPATKGSHRFDGDVSEHDHIVCRECGRLDDVFLEPDPANALRVARATGYRVLGHRAEYWGICPACRKSGK